MVKQKPDLRGLALSPLAGFRHETVKVDEWGGVSVVVREPSASDWVAWQQKLAELTGQDVTHENASTLAANAESDSNYLDATFLVRLLYDGTGARIFDDADADELASIFGPVHGRLLHRAMALGGLTDAPLEGAEKN
ncbi:hypothetical protein GY26_01840 [Gammaproteobacteria bacterium MFB021]|nr:hypothetical protein GY26_01840 [Gammaproteobacteria bacterium MFB021]